MPARDVHDEQGFADIFKNNHINIVDVTVQFAPQHNSDLILSN
jgi:hypothetical protein